MVFQSILSFIIIALSTFNIVMFIMSIKSSNKTYSEGVKKGMDIMEKDVLEFKNSMFDKAEKAYSSIVKNEDIEAAVGYLGEILSDGCVSE